MELWAREGAVPGAEAQRRVGEVLLVALDERDSLVGLSSAYLQHNEQLGMDLWYYRAFVARRTARATSPCSSPSEGRDHLQARWRRAARTRRGAGLVYEVENEGLKRYFNDAVWFPTDVTFIGENPQAITSASATTPGPTRRRPRRSDERRRPGRGRPRADRRDRSPRRSVAFWASRGLLTPEEAEERLGQVVCVLRTPGRGAAPRSTPPSRRDVAMVGGRRFWSYRLAKADDVGDDEVFAMLSACFDALAAEFADSGEGPVGVCLLVVDTVFLERNSGGDLAPSPGSCMPGFSPEGTQLRIRYFEGARI